MLFQFIFLFLLPITANFEFHDECQTLSPNFRFHLGSKTPYRTVANNDDRVINYPGCEPKRIIGFVRHGTRSCGKKRLKQMQELYKIKNLMQSTSGKSTLCSEDLKRILDWEIQMKEEGEKFLTHVGEDEMIDLAERFQNRFPQLLPETYSPSYYFRYTDTQRTQESARYFTVGLFSRPKSNTVFFPSAFYKDPILRFYKLCNRWIEEVKKNPSAMLEVKKYEEHPDVYAAREAISRTLGLNFIIPYETAKLMYLTCSFETAWDKFKVSPWCSVFTEESIKVFEYADDLKLYLRDGYGYPLNYQQACPAVRDIFSQLRAVDNYTTSIFYFTHSGTLLKLLSHFGLYKDDFRLTHDISPKLKNDRLWRVSKIDTFGTNLVFVLFKCEDGQKVVTYHQERVVHIPGCPQDTDLCPFPHLRNLFLSSLHDCNFTKICAL